MQPAVNVIATKAPHARPGDLGRLVAALKKAFGRVPPVWYLEDGFQSAAPSFLYSGAENDRSPVGETQQAAQPAAAVSDDSALAG